MPQTLSFQVSPEIGYQPPLLHQHLAQLLQIDPQHFEHRVLRRSIDARSKQIKVNIQAEVYQQEPMPPHRLTQTWHYPDVSHQPQAIIVGAGPAGLFAALRLIELGIKPVVLERGKDVRQRRRDLAALNKEEVVNPESNYCFGEGGAGTYSDGKLYTRSKKRGDIQRILEIFVHHGAVEDILVEAHPHIGTNKLPVIVQNLRQSIRDAGGEVHFETKVVDFILKNNVMQGVRTADGREWLGKGVILATGHSARDIFELLAAKQIYIEAKPFALGLRIEHPQQIIDQIQYHCPTRSPYLPAASYGLVSQVTWKDTSKGVFSFCMCPGGFIVPSATAPGEVVVNGMSPSRRNSYFANSGVVVSVDEPDWQNFKQFDALAALRFQQAVEQKACLLAGQNQHAPAQRMVDFVQKKISTTLVKTSYQPGLTAVSMDEVLPDFIAQCLRQGLQDFGKKMKGYFTNEAQLVGVESRTSSPVRIPRLVDNYEHPQIKHFFPCGEGAGFAGGIMSAAMDGEKCAEALAKQTTTNLLKA